jgi:cobaltochelatase CobS
VQVTRRIVAERSVLDVPSNSATHDNSKGNEMRDQLLSVPKVTILGLFKHLNDGVVGFDHDRLKKTECVDRLLGAYSTEQIAEALNAVGASVDVAEVTDVVPKATRSAPVAAHGVDQGAIAQQIAALFGAMASSAVDEVKVKAIVDTAIADAVKRLVNRVEVKVAEQPTVDVGVQHSHFEILLKACSARTPEGNRLNVWLRGPAGSGKTTAAKMVAKALAMTFTFNGAISTPFELTGFIDANGRCVRTPFRDAWERGGVYLFDEVDSSNPNAVTAFNAALANGVYAFPDGMVERHPDCVVIAGANTSGNGATHEYVGRMKQDGAFLDRFVEIEWPIDERLEAALVPNAAWVERVQGVRQRVKDRGIKGHMVTPRASVFGSALLAAGLDMKTVERMTLKKGLADDAWNEIK